MIGTAAASDQLQIGKRRQQFRVLVGECGDIADIDLWGCIEFGVTLGRGIGPQSADSADPGRSIPQLTGEVTRMGAIEGDRRTNHLTMHRSADPSGCVNVGLCM